MKKTKTIRADIQIQTASDEHCSIKCLNLRPFDLPMGLAFVCSINGESLYCDGYIFRSRLCIDLEKMQDER